MKFINIIIYTICLGFLTLNIGCGETEVQSTSVVKNAAIDTRSDDCEPCPVEDCCCEIEWASGVEIVLEICGPTGPFLSTSPCGPVDVGSCFTIEGFYLGPVTLQDDPDLPLLFCMAENSSFMINVLIGTASVKITCQKGTSNPQTQQLTLSALNRYFFTVDGNCAITPCH